MKIQWLKANGGQKNLKGINFLKIRIFKTKTQKKIQKSILTFQKCPMVTKYPKMHG